MTGRITIVGPRDREPIPEDAVFINTTSRSKNWTKAFSPFFLGPCKLYGPFVSKNVENGWQFSKVYEKHLNPNAHPNGEYWSWAISGWNNSRAQRYPMGKGAIPEFSYWDGEKLDYIEARKKIYIPLYSNEVVKLEEFTRLLEMYRNGTHLYLWGFDGYNHKKLGMNMNDVLNCREKKMGHAFVLAVALHKLAPVV